jgi:uroporphyrinogen decarboxylase
MTMTERERCLAALNRQPVDEMPFSLSFWGHTVERYIKEGHIKKDEDALLHFGCSCRCAGWIHGIADLDFVPQTLDETDETITQLDGNGATLRRHKLHDSTPEHIDFRVKERDAWLKLIKPHLLKLDRRRIPFDDYRNTRDYCRKHQLAFLWMGVGPFEQMHPVCGHEYMLLGMADDPEWIADMANTYAEFSIVHLKALFEEHGAPDVMYFLEDMGFKFRPFMSPGMYAELIQPAHKKLFDYAHSLGLKVMVHSCGYVEPLVPGMIEAGMDCLQAMEVKAGMDLPTLYEKFGDRISFWGGIDARALISNDFAQLDAEIEKKIGPVLRGGGGYILSSDHSEPPEVNYETIRHFIDYGRAFARRIKAEKK